jgi:metallophosphoesterase (TIGR03767 family)
VRAAGEPHAVRTDLAPRADGPAEPLVAIAHLSDLHVCDHQSPARVEFLDRWADPDSPVLEQLGEVGAYRAQELLNAQVVAATVRAVNATAVAPVSGAPVDIAVVTGDNTDNSQANELAWYLALLDGGDVVPDSGDPERYEGIADDEVWDERYWHPESVKPDRPRELYGLPTVPGLLDAVRRPFRSDGLRMPWLAVHGNHDQLVQGTVPGAAGLMAAAVGGRKAVALPEHWSNEQVLGLMAGLAACDPQALQALAETQFREVTADPARRLVSREQFVRAHRHEGARPDGHGFASDQRAYYRHDHGTVRFLAMDTVNTNGGWEGSLDHPQLAWLDSELATADTDGRYAVLLSHHPLETMVNGIGGERVLGAELLAVLNAHPSAVLWLAGHTHAVGVSAHGSLWEVVAPSLVDWPQQGRIVEVSRRGGRLEIAATMLDHSGTVPWDGSIGTVEALAGLSREVAANDWQWRHYESHPRVGTVRDRNVLMYLPDPFG